MPPRDRLGSHGYFSHIVIYPQWLIRTMRIAFVILPTRMALVYILFALNFVTLEIPSQKRLQSMRLVPYAYILGGN